MFSGRNLMESASEHVAWAKPENGKVAGLIAISLGLWRFLLSVYRRLIRKPKDAKSYGKWAIVTGTTAGIGREYADYFAKIGMSVLIISRSEEKLKEQAQELQEQYKTEVRYLARDFTDMGPAREAFYNKLDEECKRMDKEGGIGILVNNVGIANQYPQLDDEITDKEAHDMVNCNIDSTVFMSRVVLKYMKAKDRGAVINVSSGSGNLPAPYISLYSATKVFITQYSRSLHMEYLKTGVDILVVMPLYIVSNKYRKAVGTIFAPLPIKLVEGSMAQLGKKFLWQVHGYWFHTLIGSFSPFNPFSATKALNRMEDHRAKYQAKLAKQAASNKNK